MDEEKIEQYKALVGQTTEGFWFDGRKYDCGYGISMDKYIGKEGIIKKFNNRLTDNEAHFDIEFPDGSYYLYPAHIVLENHTPDIPLEELFYKISKIC